MNCQVRSALIRMSRIKRFNKRKRVAAALLLYVLLKKSLMKRKRHPLGRKWTLRYNTKEERKNTACTMHYR